MKARFPFLTLLAFLVLFSACKKDPYKYEVSGTATKYNKDEVVSAKAVINYRIYLNLVVKKKLI